MYCLMLFYAAVFIFVCFWIAPAVETNISFGQQSRPVKSKEGLKSHYFQRECREIEGPSGAGTPECRCVTKGWVEIEVETICISIDLCMVTEGKGV